MGCHGDTFSGNFYHILVVQVSYTGFLAGIISRGARGGFMPMQITLVMLIFLLFWPIILVKGDHYTQEMLAG